jgi:molecular chaperone GrpE
VTQGPFEGQGGVPEQESGAPTPSSHEANAESSAPEVDETTATAESGVSPTQPEDAGTDEGAEPENTESVNDPFEPGEADRIAAEHASAAKGSATREHPDTALAAERLGDLQRLQAEYVNYKRRVDRDRALDQERAIQTVLDSLLPVLDDIHAARQHGDLVEGPFASIADKLEATLGKFGLVRFGEVGAEFDPMVHEALMHTAWDADNAELPKDATATTVVTVLQPGYRQGERVIRPARVAVADPE